MVGNSGRALDCCSPLSELGQGSAALENLSALMHHWALRLIGYYFSYWQVRPYFTFIGYWIQAQWPDLSSFCQKIEAALWPSVSHELTHGIKPAVGLALWSLAQDIRMNLRHMIMEERKHSQGLLGGRFRQSRTNHSLKRPLCIHLWSALFGLKRFSCSWTLSPSRRSKEASPTKSPARNWRGRGGWILMKRMVMAYRVYSWFIPIRFSAKGESRSKGD